MRIFLCSIFGLVVGFALSGCGNHDGQSENAKTTPVASSVAGKYVAADGKTTLVFSGGTVKVSTKVGIDQSYAYTEQNNAVKWVYESMGVAESCEIKSATTIYCAASAQTYTKTE
jgi:ABC-type glycerol-3-phosphate transport system substrate-binding protein